jgi:DNA (cytosine-5)-methyltransferase 1
MEVLSVDLNFSTKCVGFSDIDKYAVSTYKANYNTEDEIEMGDIESFVKDVNNINLLSDYDILF